MKLEEGQNDEEDVEVLEEEQGGEMEMLGKQEEERKW